MRSHHAVYHAIRRLRKEIVLAISLSAAAILIAMLFSGGAVNPKLVTMEAEFTDTSLSGLAMVPASCPSSPHYAGECNPVCVGGVIINGSCNCPAGQVISNGQCVPVCPPGEAAPNGNNCEPYPGCTPSTVQYCGNPPPSCSSSFGQACTSSPNSCGMTAGGTYNCQGICTAVAPSNNLCPLTCWDGTVVYGSLDNCPACPEGYTKEGNQCIPPPEPEFEPFIITSSRVPPNTTASGDLQVRPSIVRPGDTALVFWKVRNVRDCTVRGSNSDGSGSNGTGVWNMTFSGTNGIETSAIQSRTTYTLFCRALVGATPATITRTAVVNIIPTWYEPPQGIE